MSGSIGGRGAPGPQGPPGVPGSAATIAVGQVTTGAPGSQATVTNVGTSGAAIFDFSIPQGLTGVQGEKGDKGDKGDQGQKGDAGAAATIAVGTVSTGLPGSQASVVNSGTSSAAVFDFSIPQGAKGDKGDTGEKGAKGDTGAAATIAVGTVTTGAPGSQVTVVNSGTSAAAVFDFSIPQGAKGDAGTPGCLSGAGAPSSSVGTAVGQGYWDTTNGDYYTLTAINPNTWVKTIRAVDDAPHTNSTNLITSGAVRTIRNTLPYLESPYVRTETVTGTAGTEMQGTVWTATKTGTYLVSIRIWLTDGYGGDTIALSAGFSLPLTSYKEYWASSFATAQQYTDMPYVSFSFPLRLTAGQQLAPLGYLHAGHTLPLNLSMEFAIMAINYA